MRRLDMAKSDSSSRATGDHVASPMVDATDSWHRCRAWTSNVDGSATSAYNEREGVVCRGNLLVAALNDARLGLSGRIE
jgi:hypothetical protein